MSKHRSPASSLHSLVWLSLGLSALLASCSSLGGKVSGGRYAAPGGYFSLPVPALSLGAAVEDKSGTDPQTKLAFGSVSFHDDFGSVRSIQYEQVPPEVAQQFSDPSRAPEMLRTYVHDMTLAQIQQFSAQAHVVQEEAVTLPDGTPAWFAVLEIPEGSTMVETSAEHPEGRRLDSTRGFLVLCHQGLFFTLSAANDFGRMLAPKGAQPAATDGVDPAGMNELKGTLTKIYASMSFG